MTFESRTMPIWNRVRSLSNGLRKKTEIVKSTPSELPYDPQLFPAGNWLVTGIVPHDASQPYLYPFFIKTNAHQPVHVWDTANGQYIKETEHIVEDRDYGLHFSSSETTLGCIRIVLEKDLRQLVVRLQVAIERKDPINLTVI